MQLIWFGNPREELPAPGTWEQGVHFPGVHGETGCEYRVSNENVTVNGRLMPLWLEIEGVTTTENFRQPSWFARVELRNGVPKIANIGFDSDLEVDREVKPSDFQRIRSAVYVFYAAFCAEIGADDKPVYRHTRAEDERITKFLELQRTGRQRLTTDDYARAADVYRENFDGTPTQAVADTFSVGIRQAGNIVAECRRRGFLPATKQGRKKA